MAKILITDGFAQEGLDILKQAGHQIDSKKLTPDELVKIIGEYDGLVIRSATQVIEQVIKAGGSRLKVIGRAGVDQRQLRRPVGHPRVVVRGHVDQILVGRPSMQLGRHIQDARVAGAFSCGVKQRQRQQKQREVHRAEVIGAPMNLFTIRQPVRRFPLREQVQMDPGVVDENVERPIPTARVPLREALDGNRID